MSFYELSQATDETGYMYMDHTLWTGYTQALGIGRGVNLLSVESVGGAVGEGVGEGVGRSFFL